MTRQRVVPKVKWNMRAKTELYEKEVQDAVKEAVVDPLIHCGMLVEREAKRLLNIGGGSTHQPSLPGTPPHKQTGNLQSSIAYAVLPDGRVIVGPGRSAFYGKIHELGGEWGGRNFPRRMFMLPALTNAQVQFKKEFAQLKLARTKAGIALNAKSNANSGRRWKNQYGEGTY